jgi:SAM-dependent methyltransferase
MQKAANNTPSLEHLIESEDVGVEVLHPGGVAMTDELARLCGIDRETRVLAVACGTGQSLCHLARESAPQFVGLDSSQQMLVLARSTSEHSGLAIRWIRADAHFLPFRDSSFDIVISEGALCHLNKLKVVSEMCRVARPGGYFGMHDLCWRPDTPDQLRRKLMELEEEGPATPDGWLDLMHEAGLIDVEVFDRSDVLPRWTRETRAKLGISGYLRVLLKVVWTWGKSGLLRIRATERLFSDAHLGYVLVVGRIPRAAVHVSS